MIKGRRADFLVGITGILGLIGLATVLVLFGELSFATKPTYNITLAVDEAGGLTSGSLITLNGVPVGTVATLATAPDPREGVVISAAINDDQRIPRAVDVHISSDLVGNTTLNLKTLPKGQGPDGIVAPEETIRADAKDLVERLLAGVDDRVPDLGATTDSVTRFADTFTRVLEKAELALDPANADPDAADQSAPNAFRTLAKIERAVDNANEWLADPALRATLDDTVADARSTFDEVRDAAQAFRDASDNISQRADAVSEGADQAVAAFVRSARRLDAALDQAQTLVAAINAGEGTAGMLAKNPDLYRNINDASVRLERMLEEFELLLRKYRTDGIEIDL